MNPSPLRSRRPRGAVVFAAALAIVAASAGCNSKDTSATATTSGSAAGTAASAKAAAQKTAEAAGVSGGGASSGGGKKVDVCSLLPVATVAQITGDPLTKAAPDDGAAVTAQYGIYDCDYTSDDGTSGVTVDVATRNGKIGYESELRADASVGAAGTTKIPGLGDAAFAAVDGVHARFGDVEITVSGVDIAVTAAGVAQNDSIDRAKTLITTLHGKL